MSAEIERQLMLDETISNIEKNQVEISKLVKEQLKFESEINKNNSQSTLNDKKSKWFEFTLVLAVIGVTITLTKLYL